MLLNLRTIQTSGTLMTKLIRYKNSTLISGRTVREPESLGSLCLSSSMTCQMCELCKGQWLSQMDPDSMTRLRQTFLSGCCCLIHGKLSHPRRRMCNTGSRKFSRTPVHLLLNSGQLFGRIQRILPIPGTDLRTMASGISHKAYSPWGICLHL